MSEEKEPSKEVVDEALNKINSGINELKHELTEEKEEETVSQQIFARDVRELEKCLVLGSRIYQILQKRAEVWQLQDELGMARTITLELFCRLYKVGFESVFEKYNQILKVLGTTQEEVLGQCKK